MTASPEPLADERTAPAPDTACAVDAGLLAGRCGYRLRLARRRLRDPDLAEDAVQDVFEAVLAGRARFSGRSALRTWLVGILLHKITDLQREGMRWCSLDGPDADDDRPGWDPACGAPWPEQIAEQRQRLTRTLAAVERLPQTLREVLWRRGVEDEPTETVCATLGISPNSLFVRLHRARGQLAALAG